MATAMSAEDLASLLPLTVAIVSRDRVYRDSLASPMRRLGLRVVALELGNEDVPASLAGIDVLVVDSDALWADDLDSVNRLRASWPLVEVVAVAGDLPVEEAVEALRAGVFSVLQHPVTDDVLVATIAEAARRYRRGRTRLEELNGASYSPHHGTPTAREVRTENRSEDAS